MSDREPSHTELERAILDVFESYWWLGEKAARQLATAALDALNGKGYLFWRYSPRPAPKVAVMPDARPVRVLPGVTVAPHVAERWGVPPEDGDDAA